MNDKIKIIEKYQNTKSDFIFEDIVKEFDSLIKFHLKEIPYNYRIDVKQIMLMGLYDVIFNRFEISKRSEINKNIFTFENLQLLEKENYKNVNKIFKSKYVNDFVEKYGVELIKSAFTCEESRDTFLNEYMLFCNEKQFIYYLNKTLINIKNDFFINNMKEMKLGIKSLNESVFDEVEMIDIVPDESTISKTTALDKYNLSEKDKDFLLSFIEKGIICTEAEVGIKYNITQQAVSKRKMEIIKKYMK